MIPPLVGIGKRLPSPRRSSGRFVGRLILAATISFDRLTGAASGTARRDATMEAAGISSGHRPRPVVAPADSFALWVDLGLRASLSSVTALRVTLMRVALVGPWVEPGPPTKEALLPFGTVDDQRWDRHLHHPSPRPDRAVDEHCASAPHMSHAHGLARAKPFPGSSFNAASPGVALVIGRVVGGKGKPHDIVLPVASEVLMEDGPGHSFVPDLSETQVSKLRAFLDSRVVAHKGKPPNERRWASVSLEQRNAVLCKWRSAATFYCPGSKWHYQLRLREPQSTEGAGKDRKEFNLVFQKVPGGQDPTWTVSIVQEAEKIWTEVRMNEAFLFSHRDRMLASQQHCFSRLCRDFRRNAQALQKVLEGIDPHSSGNGGRRLFYPGIFDMASQVQEFYDRRTRGQVDAKGVDATARLRSFNNCIKTLLLESFVDDMAGNLRILDLCCGRGQDLKKYSRAHRSCNVESLVCVDFVAEAVAEARRRYSEMAARGHEAGRPDFAASFYTGDCSSAEVFNELAQDGFSEFDVIVCQFGLHYLLGAEEDATRFLQRIFALLRPGGRFIATVPSCEVLADLYEQATPFTDSGRSRERELQQSLFQVRFEGEAWRHLDTEGGRLSLDEVFQSRWGLPYLFWLKGAVCAEEYLLPWEAFEKLAESTGFSVMADASFPDLLSLLKDKSKFFNDFFSKDRRNENMSCDEEQVFKLYSGFVLERPADTERNFTGPAKASQYLGGARTPTLAGLRALSCSGRRKVPGVQPLEDAGIGSSIQTMPPVTLPKHMAQPPPLPPVDRLPCRSQLEVRHSGSSSLTAGHALQDN
ncbi:ABD1 [Symbiodinium necroappetens]|uniref:mRNA (guanine-N(7))-methyltransferase n=1 Tax=Symbiodinium necroappetens TaxID=1628268 RepID=A0A812JAN6_9DINO|nr:ABD1 [Symbiodinium necroappetens]